MEVCSNCERSIGNLETASLFQGHIVCLQCYELLSTRNFEVPAAPQVKVLSTEKNEADDCLYRGAFARVFVSRVQWSGETISVTNITSVAVRSFERNQWGGGHYGIVWIILFGALSVFAAESSLLSKLSAGLVALILASFLVLMFIQNHTTDEVVVLTTAAGQQFEISLENSQEHMRFCHAVQTAISKASVRHVDARSVHIHAPTNWPRES